MIPAPHRMAAYLHASINRTPVAVPIPLELLPAPVPDVTPLAGPTWAVDSTWRNAGGPTVVELYADREAAEAAADAHRSRNRYAVAYQMTEVSE